MFQKCSFMLRYHSGDYVYADLGGRSRVVCRVQVVSGIVYLLQDWCACGVPLSSDLRCGYAYSWYCGYGTSDELKMYGVSLLSPLCCFLSRGAELRENCFRQYDILSNGTDRCIVVDVLGGGRCVCSWVSGVLEELPVSALISRGYRLSIDTGILFLDDYLDRL